MIQDFKQLYETCMQCQNCALHQTRNSVVFGEGSLRARVMFIGEGPGAREDATGRPFVGAAGQLLDKMLNEIGLVRSDVYIANVVKCRPPQNRDPQPQEREACIGYLRAQVAFIKPRVIVCLGRIAAGVILGREVRMTREHGVFEQRKSFLIMPTFHPAALLHNPQHEADARQDFQRLKQKLEECHAGE